MLQYRSHQPACQNHHKQPHESLCQSHAKMKSRMKEDQWKTDKAQPEMAAHPRLRPSDAPDRHFLSRPQQPRKKHTCGCDAPVSQPSRGPPIRTLWRTTTVRNIHGQVQQHRCHAADEPLPMCLINAHLSLFLFACFRRLQQAAKELQRVHAMRGIMRASIDTTDRKSVEEG